VIGDPAVFPFRDGRGYTPSPASLEAYLAMLDRYGVAQGVLVQPSVYGYDNRCLLDALDRASGRLSGIVVPSPDASSRDFEEMHKRGVRGVRSNLINPGGLRPDVVAGWQSVMRDLGWRVELHIATEEIPDLAGFVAQFGVPVVIDHMGRPTPGRTSLSPVSPALRQLIDLVRAGACRVKLSAPYRLSNQAPPWHDVTPLARALIAANPQGWLWGTDWPHVDTAPPVDTSDLFKALEAWCGTED